MKVAGISGSLRKHSINSGLLRKVSELLTEQGIEFSVVDIREFPLYNQDVNERGIPEVVMKAHQQLKAADAIVLASPEYNYSVTGVLKNSLDWVILFLINLLSISLSESSNPKYSSVLFMDKLFALPFKLKL